MTRINSNLPPEELCDKHLLAEAHEIIRTFKHASKVEDKGYSPLDYGIPNEFTLNKGHVKFFTDKLLFLWNRFFDLQREKMRRGFKVSHEALWLTDYPSSNVWYKDWQATSSSLDIIKERLQERVCAWELTNGKPIQITRG